MTSLTKEEQELQNVVTAEYIEKHRLSSSALEKRKKELQTYQVQKSEKKSVNIRLLASDIAKIKAKSEAIGIPYQTLMTIKMHEFANA